METWEAAAAAAEGDQGNSEGGKVKEDSRDEATISSKNQQYITN